METPPGSLTDGSTVRRSATGTPRVVPEKVAAPELVRPRTAVELVAVAVDAWRDRLVVLAGSSSLSDVDLLGEACLDLTGAHPSGMAQLYAGRPTRLSNIFRDATTLPTARRRLRLVVQRSQEQAERFGVAPTYLAIGVATWTDHSDHDANSDDVAALARVAGVPGAPGVQSSVGKTARQPHDPRQVKAPVLLRPVTVRARGEGESDYELTLEPSAQINPLLARALRSRGALLDPTSLAQATFEDSGFDPGSALDRVDALGRAVFDDFNLLERRIVGTFAHPGQALVDDLDELTGLGHHEVIAALAGHHPSAESMAVELPAFTGGDVEPHLERGVGDLDPSGRRVLEALATGGHLFVDAPVGADSAAVVAAVVAEAAAIGRSVLYVPGHRRAAAALKERLHDLDLDDLTLDMPADPNWRSAVSRRLLGAMTHDAHPVDVNRISRVRQELTAVRTELARTLSSLHEPRPEWGVSAYEALQALVQLTSIPEGPSTRVRLATNAARLLCGTARQDMALRLVEFAESGGLEPQAAASAWNGADLPDATAADRALVIVERLLDTKLVALGTDIAATVDDLAVAPPATVAQWREQLSVLAGMRASLDVFLPVVFERSPDDMIAATATKAWRADHGIDMSGGERRRLVKHAKDMLRPGSQVPDLHAALLGVQQQRTQWLTAFPNGGWPRLPQGLAQLERHLAEVLDDFTALSTVLAGTAEGADLLRTPFGALADRLALLRVEPTELHEIQARSTLRADLERTGLGALLTDLAERSVPAASVADELELAWWSAVFDAIVSADRYLSRVDGARIETLASRFRALDAEHLRLLVQPIKASLVAHIQRALTEHSEQADELFAELVDERLVSVRSIMASYGDVARRLRPVLVATPTLVPQLTAPHRTVDLVIIDAAQHLPLETVLSAIARGRQVLVVGDPRCASGSAIPALAGVLTQVSLSGVSASRDPNLTQFLIEHGYDGVLRTVPLPRSQRLITLDVVDGRGMVAEDSGTVESTQAEVERVVELAVTQALDHPEESLAIVASSRVHADLLREEILATVRRNPALATYFDPRRPEPVIVADLAGVSGLQRDAVIYSVGFGRTAHGRILHRFGVIGEPGGQALLLSALGVSRGRLALVSTFAAGDLDRSRLRAKGPLLLADLLAFAEEYVSANAEATVAPEQGQPNRLVIDLATRLWNSGLIVETGYGIAGGDRIPLAVGHPDFPGEFFVAVLTDDDTYVSEPSVRLRDRQWAARLERLGWTAMQVWSVSLFLDPERQANRIRQTVLGIAQRRREGTAPVTGALPTLLDAQSREWVTGALDAGTSANVGGLSQGFADSSQHVGPGDEPHGPLDGQDHSEARPLTAELPAYAGEQTGTFPVITAAIAVAPQVTGGDGQVTDGEVADGALNSGGMAESKPDDVGQMDLGQREDESDDQTLFDIDSSLAPSPSTASDDAIPVASDATELSEAERPEADHSTVVQAAAVQSAVVQSAVPVAVPLADRPERPAVVPGLPISAYGDDDLDDMVRWIASDGISRTTEQWAATLRTEMGIKRRNHRVDVAVNNAVARWLGV